MPDSQLSPVGKAKDLLERAGAILELAHDELNQMNIEEPEIRAVCEHAVAGIVVVMREAAKGKHAPWKWAKDDEDEHIRKGLRHALTYQLERDGYQKATGEDHLMLAMTRLAMAYARRLHQPSNPEIAVHP